MSTMNNNNEIVQPGSLGELFALYLQRQIHAENQGLRSAESKEEFVPHDSNFSQLVEPQLAWKESQIIFRLLQGLEKQAITRVPPGWSHLINSLHPLLAIPMALGNFPQLMNNPLILMNSRDLASLRPTAGEPVGGSELIEWAKGQSDPISKLFAAGVLRLAADFSGAHRILNQTTVDNSQMPVLQNELAALAWHEGNHEEAIQLWNRLPSIPPVLFNRGMTSLFCGQYEEALKYLLEVVNQFSEKNSWYHLGQLYINLAEAQI